MKKAFFPLCKELYKPMELDVTDEQYERLEAGEDPESVIEGFKDLVNEELKDDCTVHYHYMASKGDGPDAMAEEMQSIYLKTRIGTFEIDTIPKDNNCLGVYDRDLIEITLRDSKTGGDTSLLRITVPVGQDEVDMLVSEYVANGCRLICSTSTLDDMASYYEKTRS